MVDALDDATAVIRRSGNGGCTWSALALADAILADDSETARSWSLSIDPCGELSVDVPPEGFDDAVRDIHGRWVSSGRHDMRITVTADTDPDEYGPEREVRIDSLDEGALP